MTAVLALRPDGARGVPPALDGDTAAGGTPNGRAPVVAYLDEVIAGQPDGHLAGADLPAADNLAAFVHTGGTTGAPKVAAHTHANQLACGRGIALCSGLAAGEGMLGGLPLFHVNALIVTGIAPMFSGARVVWPGPAGYRDRACTPGSGKSSSTTGSRRCRPSPPSTPPWRRSRSTPTIGTRSVLMSASTGTCARVP